MIIKLWLDDLLDDPNSPDRHTPEGWIGCKTALAACRLLARGYVENGIVIPVSHISFDHDLGDDKCAGNGYLVAKFIEKRAYQGKLAPLTWDIHSSNPVGASNIASAMKHAEYFWKSLW